MFCRKFFQRPTGSTPLPKQSTLAFQTPKTSFAAQGCKGDEARDAQKSEEMVALNGAKFKQVDGNFEMGETSKARSPEMENTEDSKTTLKGKSKLNSAV